jgi:hypothetical protein
MDAFSIHLNNVLSSVAVEVTRACSKHSPMASHHEAYAVILEEVDEYWEEVKKRQPDRERLREELIQIAAMAVRAQMDCE